MTLFMGVLLTDLLYSSAFSHQYGAGCSLRHCPACPKGIEGHIHISIDTILIKLRRIMMIYYCCYLYFIGSCE